MSLSGSRRFGAPWARRNPGVVPLICSVASASATRTRRIRQVTERTLELVVGHRLNLDAVADRSRARVGAQQIRPSSKTSSKTYSPAGRDYAEPCERPVPRHRSPL